MAIRQRTPGSQTSLREANRARIVAAIKKHGGLTQVELAGVTGLSPATVSNIVRELTSSGIAKTTPSTRSGRRALLVTFTRATGIVAGLHVSSRHLRIIVADVNRTVLSEKHMPLARDHRADNELNRAALLLSDMLESIGARTDDLLAIALALSAPMLGASGYIANRGSLRGWTGVDIAATTQARLRRPVVVENAANLSALAELRLGAARNLHDIVYVDAGDDISAGLILSGTLFRGHHGSAGEIGHTVVVEGGPPCRCGNRGCLEAVAGGRALIRLLEPTCGPMKVADIVAHAMSNDPQCLRSLSDAGKHLGVAVGNLCNVIDPQRIVIGGELARCGELLLGPIRQAMEHTVIGSGPAVPDVVQAQLGLRSAALGAVLRAISAADVNHAAL